MKKSVGYSSNPAPGRRTRQKTLSVFRVSAILFWALVLYPVVLNSQSFRELIERIRSLPESRRQAVADSFVNSQPVLPYLENDTTVHFIYNNAAQTVVLAGDVTEWKPGLSLTCITGTHFWYHSACYPSDARLDYKFVVNDSSWILDPKNPLTCMSGFGPNSELRMPGYMVSPEIAYYSAIPHGVLIDTTCYSSNLGNSRIVSIYLPDGYPASLSEYPVVLFHDGPDYINLCKARNILDYLIANRLMIPVVAVFVPPVDRTEEYAGSKIDKFTAFITDELMPAVDARYHTSRNPAKRATIGASNGGNIALFISIKHPEIFGMAGAQSSNVIPFISSTLQNGPKLPLQFYFDIGSYDIPELIPMAANLKNILESKGYPFQFQEWHEGHSWGNWMGHLRLSLIRFFPYLSGSATPPSGDNDSVYPDLGSHHCNKKLMN